MKKSLLMTAVTLTALSCVACSGKSGAKETDAKSESTAQIQTQEKDGMASVKKILWDHAGNLEAQEGFENNIGTAGMLHGVSNGYVIVAGGANFPEGGPETGGKKFTYPDVYVMKAQEGQLELVQHSVLDYKVGYGASITSDDGIYYLGGSPEEDKANKIMLLKADDSGKVTFEEVGDLPFAFSDGMAVLKDDKIYVGAGKQDGKASDKFYEYDIKTKETKELESIPGESTRTQCVSQILDDKIYVFSGGDAVAYTDGYCYDVNENKWTQVSDVKAGDTEISLLGAGSVKLNDSEMMVIGGFNKDVYDNAVHQLGTLKDDELQAFKNEYFGADPSELQWNKQILIYNAKTDEWRSIGEVPFDAPCGEALETVDGYIYSINGEIKPGTRTSAMYGGMFIQ